MRKYIISVLLALLLLTGLALADGTYYVEKDTYAAPPLMGEEWTYTIENGSVLRISTYGKFKGLKLGKTVIEAMNGTERVTIDAEVVPKITGISLTKNTVMLKAGETYAPEITVKPSSATAKALRAESSDESVAFADADGVVRAVGPGSCKIKFTSAEKTATLTVTVYLPAERVSFPEEAYSVNVKSSLELSPVFEPAGAGADNIDWNSSDPSVLTVKNGKVTALKAGEAVISATLPNGLYAQCTVRAVIPVQKITLKKTTVKVGGNKQAQIEWTLSPSNATETALTFTSSNPAVATVDENGIITGVSKGACRVTVMSASGKKAVVDVQVSWKAVKGINNLTLQAAPYAGETYAIKASVEPFDASDGVIFYMSSDPEIASVDENGVITARKEGSAVITMTTREVGFFSGCAVTVRPAGEKRLAGVTIGINPGHQIKKNAKQAPIAPGSKTMGALNNGCAVGVKTRIYEYQLTLDVSLILRDLLEEAGATVIMTRTENDVELTNIERAEMLNAAQVDLAVQIHADNSEKNTKHGLSTYSRASGEFQIASSAASILVHDAMLKSTGAADAGVHLNDGYMSLNYSTTPTILVEMGYMSNPEEDVLMSTPEYQRKLAQGMFDGICDFMGR